ncbi:MAG TPA: arylsulfatase [Chthoniobacteraceae bacterium]|nr:arylsulfatase [Chthoniobacteraceae bacterium]
MKLPRSALLLVVLGAFAIGSQGAPPARPNFVFILADDLGFSDIGCYGGEIATPNLDRLAANGLRFTSFYNTARCWPSRAAFLSGYYPQQIRMDPPRGRLPAWTRTLPQYLKPLGYRSYHSGKWHIEGAPRSVADAGFDHSYRVEDHDHNFSPKRLLEDDRPLPPIAPDSGYYTAIAYTDRAIAWLQEHALQHAGEPFFTYLAFTTPHFPLQAPPEDIARYRDKYLAGWEAVRAERFRRQKELGLFDGELSKAEAQIRAPSGDPGVEKKIDAAEVAYALPWNELTDEQRRFQATKMAIHAAMVDRIDQEIGRLIAQLKDMGAFENTVIFFASDNGASAEILLRGDGHDPAAEPGSAKSFLCLGPGWSTVSNTPFRRHKIWVHEGGISTPLIVHWPAGIAARGELRRDLGHFIDLVPTMLELAGGKAEPLPVGAPPLPGRSLVPDFARDGAVTRDFLFFHHEGNRALRMGDWKLVSARIDADAWELYNLATDGAEMHNLASENPERVRSMAARWQELELKYRRQAGEPPPKKRPGAKSRSATR